ncbi:MAG: hypothetical protein HY695_33785 [Deltaproteobacteria bacterium]|nr:hypothetical protein [Deltaproteobacteria bacterium]
MGGLPANQTVNGFAIDPENPKFMHVAMKAGLFRSADGGETWKPLGKALKNLAAVVSNPQKPAEIYAATAEGKLYFSKDGGQSWKVQGK